MKINKKSKKILGMAMAAAMVPSLVAPIATEAAVATATMQLDDTMTMSIDGKMVQNSWSGKTIRFVNANNPKDFYTKKFTTDKLMTLPLSTTYKVYDVTGYKLSDTLHETLTPSKNLFIVRSNNTNRANMDFYNVTFFAEQGSNEVLEKKQVLEGNKVLAPNVPTNSTKNFAGWVDEKGQPFDITKQLITKATKLYATWTDKKLELTVDEMKTSDVHVRGTVSPDVKKVNIYLNGNKVRTRNVETDFTFYGHVSNTLQVGDKVKVEPINASGEVGAPIEITVADTYTNGPTLTRAYFTEKEYLRGNVNSGTTYIRVYTTNEKGEKVHLRKRNIESDNTFYVYILDGVKKGTEVTVVPFDKYDRAGKEYTFTYTGAVIKK